MAQKKNPVSPAAPLSLVYPENQDDLSSHLHRLTIGFLGAFLPVGICVVSALRPLSSNPPPQPLKSISAYYYSGAVMIFSGVLVALAVFFITYRGYRNKDHWKDILAAFIAGIAALGVALFPTEPASSDLMPLWWRPWMGDLHIRSAGVLFLSFIFFSVVLFPISPGKKRNAAHFHKRRNQVYYVCGAVMAACVIDIAFRDGKTDAIFWPESIALEFFAISWFAKAHADWTAAQLFYHRPKDFLLRLTRSRRR